MDKCHGERYTQEIVFIVLAPITERLIHDVGLESVAMTFGYKMGEAWDCQLPNAHEVLIRVSER